MNQDKRQEALEAVRLILYMPVPIPDQMSNSDSLAFVGEYLRREQPPALVNLLLAWCEAAQAAEREACAQLVEGWRTEPGAVIAAAAIRARDTRTPAELEEALTSLAKDISRGATK